MHCSEPAFGYPYHKEIKMKLSKDMEHKYQAIDSNGYFIGSRLYQWSDSHIETKAPKFDPETQRAKWNGKKWIIEDIPDAK